jgi:dipeptide/tripeptide permease
VATDQPDKKAEKRSKFHPLFWLVVTFEFFERGSYYGMMSVLSVYMTEHLHFAKTDVGLIKSTIQPLLYFLPIISGALADRFGYRRTLMIAFSLLGTGYFLTSQSTGYAAVFLSLVVMAVGAGTFKPVISGSIARCTDETNATLGFGIFYWTINLGAFLFPLVLVPFLKNNIGWRWVIIAAAIGTGSMLLPTFLFFREPPRPPETKEEKKKPKSTLLQTVANAFEIIYSPVVLLNSLMRSSGLGATLIGAGLVGLLAWGAYDYTQPGTDKHTLSARRIQLGNTQLNVKVQRDLGKIKPYDLQWKRKPGEILLTLNDPNRFPKYADKLLAELRTLHGPGALRVAPLKDVLKISELYRIYQLQGLGGLTAGQLEKVKSAAVGMMTLVVVVDRSQSAPFGLKRQSDHRYTLTLNHQDVARTHKKELRAALDGQPELATLNQSKLNELVGNARNKSFFMLFVGLLLLGAFVVIRIAPRFKAAESLGSKLAIMLLVMGPVLALLWLLPNLSVFARILCTAIALTLLSLYEINTDDVSKFGDHARFLLMIFLYAGFWVLYFQMFDSVLWYVKAYVDASSLNSFVNGVGAWFGADLKWRFDIEHVTVINAATIITLQLYVSHLVKNTKALPTMIVGICMGTVGMAILALSTGIWVFMLGIVIFSVGEMTAHPKFIAYVGQTAPKSRVAMYMGYLFLYGVIGASIGGVLGANLYVEYVDQRNEPRTLWLIFTSIGVATVVGLLLYNRFFGQRALVTNSGDEDDTGSP